MTATVSGTRCEPLLGNVDSAFLDCVGDDLAVLLAAAGVADLRTPFGAEWQFVLNDDDLPTLDLPPADLDDRIAARTGLRPVTTRLDSIAGSLPAWRDQIALGRPVLVLVDAFALPWVPYAGHEHLSHGFVVDSIGPDDVLGVVDPYDNATQWGRAVPTTATITAADLEAAVVTTDRPCSWTVLVEDGPAAPVDLLERLAANARSLRSADEGGDLDRFAVAHRAPDLRTVENLTMQAWLASRNRGLHALWLHDRAAEDVPGAEVAAATAARFDDRVLPAWARVTETTYVAVRRLRSGRAAPTAHVEALSAALTAEREVAAELGAHLATRTGGRS